MPDGSIILYDTYGIHRAKPIASRSFTRKSIFFQVDASPDNAEKILVNPAFVDDRDERLLDFLGFGQKHDFPANPPTLLKHAPVGVLLRFQRTLLMAYASRLLYGLGKTFLSHDARMRWAATRRGFARRLQARHPSVFRFLRRLAGGAT
jgi:hypothetical protein